MGAFVNFDALFPSGSALAHLLSLGIVFELSSNDRCDGFDVALGLHSKFRHVTGLEKFQTPRQFNLITLADHGNQVMRARHWLKVHSFKQSELMADQGRGL